MSMIVRCLLFPVEALVYGISYAWIKFKIRSPRPLNTDAIWQEVNREVPAPVAWVRDNWPPRFLRPLLLKAKLKQDHVLGISQHYDVSNEFYELFLDKKYMFYSCSDFHSPDETLEQAQQHKADHILQLIDPKPGEKILELGCGWGAMLKRIYEHTGDKEHLYGITLSKEQVAYNDQQNGFKVEFDNFITKDYPREYYDAIYSIGAWEHVRPGETASLSKKLYDAVKPGGRVVHHFFCRTTDTLMANVAVSQIYFPGSIGGAYHHHVQDFEDAGFRITHRSIHDYRPTLRAWFDNLVANRERALEIVDVQTFNRYLTFFPASWFYFNSGKGMLIRWILQKPA